MNLIFSRFGKILSCEVIRDKRTGDSLQYAFIEFEQQKDCEQAYFKMQGVLIDDHRIHVDFSQSVRNPAPESRTTLTRLGFKTIRQMARLDELEESQTVRWVGRHLEPGEEEAIPGSRWCRQIFGLWHGLR